LVNNNDDDDYDDDVNYKACTIINRTSLLVIGWRIPAHSYVNTGAVRRCIL